MSDHSTFMAAAIAEAEKRRGWTSPNPCVGAVIVHNDKIISRGHHFSAGKAHAEMVALSKLQVPAEECTLYITLEPCTHDGKTGPCTAAILNAGIKRVVIGAIDPNPLVRRRGVRALRKAGIQVDIDVLEAACRELNVGYNFAIVNHRPWVLMKAAMSLDGRVATRTGDSQWITSPKARARGRQFRGQVDAICVGLGTVLADDPKLTARLRGKKDPLRVILDGKLRTPMTSQVVRTAPETPTLIATTRESSEKKRECLQSAGIDVVLIKKDRRGHVDLKKLLEALYQRGVMSLLVEGGAEVQGCFVDANLVDRVAMFLAPRIIGGKSAPSGVGGRGVARLKDAMRLETPKIERLGPDILILADTCR